MLPGCCWKCGATRSQEWLPFYVDGAAQTICKGCQVYQKNDKNAWFASTKVSILAQLLVQKQIISSVVVCGALLIWVCLHTFSRTFYAPANVCMCVHILSLSGSMPASVDK